MFWFNPYLLLGLRYFLHSCSRVLGGDLLVANVAERWFYFASCVTDSKSSHGYPFLSAYIVVWHFLVEMVCHVVYFGSICRTPNSVPFFPLWSLKLVLVWDWNVGFVCSLYSNHRIFQSPEIPNIAHNSKKPNYIIAGTLTFARCYAHFAICVLH